MNDLCTVYGVYLSKPDFHIGENFHSSKQMSQGTTIMKARTKPCRCRGMADVFVPPAGSLLASSIC